MQPEIVGSPLPTELWMQVIRELPAHYKRSCLSVSKLFHDVSVQFVFASINVRLGLIRDNFAAHRNRWCTSNDEEDHQTEAAIRRSCELLQHIARSPGSGIAQAVRYVSVRAYSLYGKSPPSELIDALDEALSMLRLQRFAWYGCHPMPRRQAIEALCSGSGETLEDMTLPPGFLDHMPIQGLACLRSLSFLNRYAACYKSQDGDESGDEDEIPCRYDWGSIIATTSLQLHSLGMFGAVFLKCNVERLSTLVELTLALINDLDSDPLALVLTCCSQLQFLTLLVGDEYQGDVTATLRAHSDSLPLLTAFRLSDPSINQMGAQVVASFLRKKTRLERLDIGHHWWTCYSEDLEPILAILPELPCLRTLGWELRGASITNSKLTRDQLLSFSARIPARITSLALWVAAQSRTSVKEEDWVQFFRGLRACHFIHILTDREYFGTTGSTVQTALLNRPPPVAELVGFNENMAWVEHDPKTGRVKYSEAWSLSKVYNRTAEEFGCEEWEWLMRSMDMRLV